MHIPDGFLSPGVAVTSAALSAVGVSAACARASRRLGRGRVATLGVVGAFVFAAEMLNFPVALGTSGHMVGGLLAAVVVGPEAAVVVMTSVIALQCLAYGDGGILALGANVLNMALLHPLVGFVVYRAALGAPGVPSTARRLTAVALGAWVATLVAAAACAGELSLSGIVSPGLVLASMLGVHAVIGLGEAIVTVLVVRVVLQRYPRALSPVVDALAPPLGRAGVALGLACSFALALFVSPFACKWPDGLERVADSLGLHAREASASSFPLAGYALPGVSGPASVSMAAALGVALMVAVCGTIGAVLAPASRAE